MTSAHSRRIVTFLVTGAASLALAAQPARGYTPESPKVKQIVARALKYMEQPVAGGPGTQLGGVCLIGLAVLKATDDPRHRKVQLAVQTCRTSMSRIVEEDNYSTAIALIFLCELDPIEHREMAEQLLQELHKRQRRDGAWSYPGYDTGDTSQTQYGVLATYIAASAGIATSQTQSSMEQVCNWLLRTQDPSGAWSYQGNDPGSFQRVPQKQEDIRLSLCAAGLGSIYVAADVLNLLQPVRRREPGLPAALERVDDPRDRVGARSAAVNPQALKRGIDDGNQWFGRNYSISTNRWQHYYLYALERYMSFRERTEGRVDPEPEWYNQGVDFLGRTQAPDGSWSSNESTTAPQVDTAFSVLFLLRSTRKIFERIEAAEGLLIAGKELPTDLSMARLKGNKVVDTPLDADVQDLISILEEQEAPIIDAGEVTERLLQAEESSRDALLARLRELVSVESYQARRVAVRALGRSGDMDNVPLLIFALSDPDSVVMHEAQNGLRFISRKLDAFPLPDEPTPEDIGKVQKQWKQWYQSIRPEADLQVLDRALP